MINFNLTTVEITIHTPDEAFEIYNYIGSMYFANASAKEIILLKDSRYDEISRHILCTNMEKYPSVAFLRMLISDSVFEDLNKLSNPKAVLCDILEMVSDNIDQFPSRVLVRYIDEFGKIYSETLTDVAYKIWKKYPDVSFEHIKFVDDRSERSELIDYLEKEFGYPESIAVVCDDYIALKPSLYEDFKKDSVAKPRKFIICKRKDFGQKNALFITDIYDSFETSTEEAEKRFSVFAKKHCEPYDRDLRLLDITSGYNPYKWESNKCLGILVIGFGEKAILC